MGKRTPDDGQPDPLTTAETSQPAAAPAAIVPPVAEVDEHHGMGGHYELVDGKRVLVHRTQVEGAGTSQA